MCVHVHAYVCVCVCTCLCVRVRAHVCVCVYVCVYECVCVHVRVRTWASVWWWCVPRTHTPAYLLSHSHELYARSACSDNPVVRGNSGEQHQSCRVHQVLSEGGVCAVCPQGYLLYGQCVLASLSLLVQTKHCDFLHCRRNPLTRRPLGAMLNASRLTIRCSALGGWVTCSLISISANEWCCMHKATACVDPSQHSHSALNYSVMSLMHGLRRQGGQLSMSRMC